MVPWFAPATFAMRALPVTLLSTCVITSESEYPFWRPDQEPSTVCTGARGESPHATTATATTRRKSLRIPLNNNPVARLRHRVASPRSSESVYSGEPYLQAGSPSEAPVTTGLVVLIPTPHENGLA